VSKTRDRFSVPKRVKEATLIPFNEIKRCQSCSTFAAADGDFVSERRASATDEPIVVWAASDWLDVVIQGDVGEDKL